MDQDQNGQPAAIGLGMHVILELALDDGSQEQLEADIVPDEYADLRAGFLGVSTPLARAVEGLTAGREIPYRVGDARRVRVILVEPARTPPPKEVADRRQETYRKAVEQSDRTNAMIFASSFSGKWGDYDPTGFEIHPELESQKEKKKGAPRKPPLKPPLKPPKKDR